MKKKAPKGVILYLGKSKIDGKEVVAILTFESGNVKTGGNALFIVISLSFLFQYK